MTSSSYEKDLQYFKDGLTRIEKLNKKGIEKMARALEEAGTVKTHKISERITIDLKPMIDKGLIDPLFIPEVLNAKYKEKMIES